MDGGLDRCMRSAHHIAADRLDIRSYDGQDSFGNDSVGTVSDANEANPGVLVTGNQSTCKV